MTISPLVAGMALSVGATIQGMVCFGVSLMATPVIATIPPHLLPGPLLVTALAAAPLSARSWRPRQTPGILTTVGRFSGAIANGRPPLALLYQQESAAQIRSTLGAYLMPGGILSTASLASAGLLNAGNLVRVVHAGPVPASRVRRIRTCAQTPGRWTHPLRRSDVRPHQRGTDGPKSLGLPWRSGDQVISKCDTIVR